MKWMMRLSSDFFRTGACRRKFASSQSEKEISRFCFACLQDFLWLQTIYSAKWLIAGLNLARIEIQMESIWITDEPTREPFLSVWTSQEKLLSLRVNLQNQTHHQDEHPSEKSSPWALSHMNEPWNQDDEFKLHRIALGWEFPSSRAR